MFRIGEFSKIGRVTIDTLRHYDALGLLRLVKVDPFTGYRYYSAKKLQLLNRIITLKEVGLSLDEIARILQDKLTTDELRGMLKAQLVLADSDIETARLRRERILARLKTLTLEDKMPAYEITLKSVEALTVAAVRETVATAEQMPQRCGEMLDAIAGWMNANHLPFGPAMTIYYNEGYKSENVDTECAFVVPEEQAAKTAKPEGKIIVRQMEAVPHMATTIVAGDFYQKFGALTPAYNAIGRWIEDNGYRIVALPREVFYGSPESGDLTAEIQFPVEKV